MFDALRSAIEWVDSHEASIRTFRRKWIGRWLTPAGTAYVAAGVVLGIFSLDIDLRQTYLFWSTLFAIGLASLTLGLFRRLPVRLEREAPPRVSAGATVTYGAFVSNLSTSPLTQVCIREESAPDEVEPLAVRGISAVAPFIGPGETCRVALKMHFPRRGVFDLDRLRAEQVCPLGLIRWGRTMTSRSRVVVLPRYHPIDRIEFTDARVYQPGGVPLSRSVGESAELVGLRDYRPGDPMRHISWTAWARTGEPVVREYQAEYYRRVAVVLDTRVRFLSEWRTFEAAVSVAASIAHYFEKNEYIIDLFAAGPDVYYLQTGLGLSHMTQVLELLACVRPTASASFPRLDEALRRVLNRLSGMILVTTDWAAESRGFHRRLSPEVPQIKVVVVRPDRPLDDPVVDVPDRRLLKIVDPSNLQHDILSL